MHTAAGFSRGGIVSLIPRIFYYTYLSSAADRGDNIFSVVLYGKCRHAFDRLSAIKRLTSFLFIVYYIRYDRLSARKGENGREITKAY